MSIKTATLGITGRANSRVHVARPGWTFTAECGVMVTGTREGKLREATCPKCRTVARSR